MPFDDTYNSYESFKLAHTEPVLVADKNYRIVREDDSQAKYGRLMMYFGLVVMFMLISGQDSMIQPMTTMDNYTKFILTIIALSTSILAEQSFFTKDCYHYVKTGEVQLILSPMFTALQQSQKKFAIHPLNESII